MIKFLIYCTKSAPYLRIDQVYDEKLMKINGKYKTSLINSKFNEYEKELIKKHNFFANGKIVAQFDCEKVEEIFYNGWWECYANDKDDINCLRFFNELACLTTNQIKEYLGDKKGYAIHISNLEIFDEPKELYEYDIKPKPFKTIDGWSITNITYSCTKAPQNMFNVYDSKGNHYVLISIRPEWVEKILNGEKTIEVRKSIVNKLKELI